MDNTLGYELRNGGSIPSEGTKLFRCGHSVMVAPEIVILLVWVRIPVVTPKQFDFNLLLFPSQIWLG